MRVRHETSAGGIVFKRRRSHLVWLITQHSQHKGWVFPKGLVGDTVKDEAMEEAALREVEEEGGVEAKIIVKLPAPVSYAYQWKGELIKKTVYYYLMEYISGDPKNHDWEMMDAKFVDESEVERTLSYPTDKKAFEQALALL